MAIFQGFEPSGADKASTHFLISFSFAQNVLTYLNYLQYQCFCFLFNIFNLHYFHHSHMFCLLFISSNELFFFLFIFSSIRVTFFCIIYSEFTSFFNLTRFLSKQQFFFQSPLLQLDNFLLHASSYHVFQFFPIVVFFSFYFSIFFYLPIVYFHVFFHSEI